MSCSPASWRGLTAGRLATGRKTAGPRRLGHAISHVPRPALRGPEATSCPRPGAHEPPTAAAGRRAYGNLDRATGRQVMELVAGAQAEGCTVVVVTHDPEIAAAGRPAPAAPRRATGRLTRGLPACAIGPRPFLVLSSRWKTGVAEALLVGLVAMVAAGVLSAAWLARGAADILLRPSNGPSVPPSTWSRSRRPTTGERTRGRHHWRLQPGGPRHLGDPGHAFPRGITWKPTSSWARAQSCHPGTPRQGAEGRRRPSSLAGARSGRGVGGVPRVHGEHAHLDKGLAGESGRYLWRPFSRRVPDHPVADVVLGPFRRQGGGLPAPSTITFGLWTTEPPSIIGPALARALPSAGSWSRLASVPGDFAVINGPDNRPLGHLRRGRRWWPWCCWWRPWCTWKCSGGSAGSATEGDRVDFRGSSGPFWLIEWAPVTFLRGGGRHRRRALSAKPVARLMTQLYGAVPYLPGAALTAVAVVALVVRGHREHGHDRTRRIGERAICQQLRL